MPILQAEVQTERASRYLVQFCKHAAAMGSGGHTSRMHLHGTVARRDVHVSAEWSDTSGTVTFNPWGQFTLTADSGTLTLRIDGADEDGLAQIRDVVTRDFERFSRRNPLTVAWQEPETPGAAPFRHVDGMTPKPRRSFPRSNLQTVVLALAVILVIGLHIGLAGTVLAESQWTGVAINVIAALVVLKIALAVGARFAFRHRRATKSPDHISSDQPDGPSVGTPETRL
jgi:hypothetical protein